MKRDDLKFAVAPIVAFLVVVLLTRDLETRTPSSTSLTTSVEQPQVEPQNSSQDEWRRRYFEHLASLEKAPQSLEVSKIKLTAYRDQLDFYHEQRDGKQHPFGYTLYGTDAQAADFKPIINSWSETITVWHPSLPPSEFGSNNRSPSNEDPIHLEAWVQTLETTNASLYLSWQLGGHSISYDYTLVNTNAHWSVEKRECIGSALACF